MNVAFRPARPQDFDYCERLYFAEMERINRELKLDRAVQVASFRRQWEVMQVRIITLDGADIGWLQSTTRAGAYFRNYVAVSPAVLLGAYSGLQSPKGRDSAYDYRRCGLFDVDLPAYSGRHGDGHGN
jgi:hypothetical protein